jgi:hypothetical protein
VRASAVLVGTVADGDEPYRLLAFEVPVGCDRVTVRYHHDPGSILDLGLLDPRATGFPTRDGFRGWSGSARREVFVARTEATPGYLPGPLPPGRWHVLLGLARVARGGCRFTVEVEVTPAGTMPIPAAAPAVRDAPAESGGADPAAAAAGWYPGDLQTHTHHSDAHGSLDELLAAARTRGLRYLAVTDHNTVSHHAPLRARSDATLLGVPGMEVTSYRGHANVWGASGWVDFRLRDDDDVAAMVTRAHELGGLVSINHPKTQPGCIGCDWEYAVPADVDAFEAWQGPWLLRNWESLARLDRLLAGGRRLTLVGGSDRHQPAGPERDPPWLQVGSPTTWLWLERFDVAGVKHAIAHGRASVSEGPGGPQIELEAAGAAMGARLPPAASHLVRARVRGAAGERLRWVGASGVVRQVVLRADCAEDAWSWVPDGPFLRAEVVADATLAAARDRVARIAAEHGLPLGLRLAEVFAQPFVRALSNPLYV